MKKILAILLTVALMVPCFATQAFAVSSSTDVLLRSLHFTMSTSGITAGMNPDEIDQHTVSIYCAETDSTNTTYYIAGLRVNIEDLQCLNTTQLKAGESVRLKFWVSVSGKDERTESSTKDKYFYISSSTSVHVGKTDGDDGPSIKSTSKTRSGSYELAITVTTSGIKGQYSEPCNLVWTGTTLGQAQWNSPEDGNNVGYYDVKLKRNDSTVYTQTSYNATSINLYPWMTKEGDYTFSVRSVVTSSGSGAKNSDWVESDVQIVAKDKVSDGSGQSSGGSGSGSSSNVGWKQVGTDWYYYYPDGTMKKNGWEKISNKWYLFGSDGKMLKGWQNYQNNTYYLDSTNGDMKTGWINTSDGQWYYLTAPGTGGTEGAMYKSSFLDYKNYRYYLGSTGAMATGWTKIGQDTYYFRPNESDGCPKGSMVTNQRVDSFWLGADGKWVQGQ